MMAPIINLDLNFNLFRMSLILLFSYVLSLFSFSALGCAIGNNSQGVTLKEIVLVPGMSLTAYNSLGSLTVMANDKLQRTFNWEGGTRSVKMLRRNKRFNGSLGIYFPGEGNHWKEHDGVTRAVIDEGVLNFESIKELLSYIEHYNDKEKYAYTDDGIFVFWDKRAGAGGTLVVKLWQFLINQEKPKGIPGSNNEKIVLERYGQKGSESN